MDNQSNSRRMWLYILFGLAIFIGLIYYVLRMTGAFEAGMSGHGWAALVGGVVFSVLIGGGLTAALVWGRRNGYDEGAHDMHWNEPDDDSAP